MDTLIHPLDDIPEQKLFRPGMGRMHMTTGTRAALLVLQGYLAGMVALMAFHFLAL